MIDTDEIAYTIELFAHLGDTPAIDSLIEMAEREISKGRKDLATYLMNMSDKFLDLWREGKEVDPVVADSMRTISTSLRTVAHRLHIRNGESADDQRLLRLVIGGR